MPKSLNTLWKEALALGEQDRCEECIAAWREILRLHPDEGGAYTNLGTALCQAGQWEAAIAAYQKAIRIDPVDADNHYRLGNALVDTGQLEAALEQWDEALRIDPSYVDVLYNKGHALYRAGRYGDAVACWRECTRLMPDDVGAHNSLGSAYVRKAQESHAREDWRQALAAYQRALHLAPQDATALWWIGHLEWKFGARRAAEQTMKQAILAEPDYQEAYEELTRMQFFQGRWRDSIRTAQAATERSTYDPQPCRVCLRRLTGAVIVLALLTAGVLLWTERRQKNK